MARYIVEDHPSKIGWKRVTDTHWNVICDFVPGRFNETQKIVSNGTLDTYVMFTPQIMRELGEFIVEKNL